MAEITSTVRGLASEVAIDPDAVNLDRESVVNCDGLHTVAQASLTTLVGEVNDDVMGRVCAGVTHAIGC